MILIDGFEIDVTLSEEHSFDNEVTEHPVESGADVADHVRARPIQVTLEGVVSNSPIGSLRDRRVASGLGGVVDPTSGCSQEAFKRLMAIRDAREPVSIDTALQHYDNMLLESLSVPMDDTDALNFRATFKQVVIITNLRTAVTVKEPRDAKKLNRGHKAPKKVPLTPAQAAPTTTQKAVIDESVLAKDARRRAALMDFLSPRS